MVQPPATGSLGKLLLVEDDPSVASQLVRGLGNAGFQVELVRDGALAREALASAPLDLMILDLMLPGMSGFQLLEALQGRPHPPIIVLTARTDIAERLRCFALGAADYVPKPFFLEELIARVRARLPLGEGAPRRIVRWAEVELDLDARTVKLAGELLELTRYELDVLAYLVQRPGRAIAREQLAERALAALDTPEPRTIDTHVARIRKKLGDRGAAALQTVWGIGYRFLPEEPVAAGPR
jgi:two-component system, OmpR family, response regulator